MLPLLLCRRPVKTETFANGDDTFFQVVERRVGMEAGEDIFSMLPLLAPRLFATFFSSPFAPMSF